MLHPVLAQGKKTVCCAVTSDDSSAWDQLTTRCPFGRDTIAHELHMTGGRRNAEE